MPVFLRAIFALSLISAGVFAFMFALLYAAEKESAHNEQIRSARCERFGENLPHEWRGYCVNLGV